MMFLVTILVLFVSIWYYFFYPVKTSGRKAYSKEGIPAGETKNHLKYGPTYHAFDFNGKFEEWLPNPEDEKKPIYTLYELMERSAKVFKNDPCLGFRPLIEEFKTEKVIDGENRTLIFPQLGPYQWLTYGEVYERCINFASGLRTLGLEPTERLAIFEDTRVEWTIAHRGAFIQNYVLFTVYANLGMDALVFALNQGKIKYIVSNGALLNSLIAIKEKVETLEFVIYTDKEKVTEDQIEKAKKTGLKLFTFEETEEIGKKHPHDPVPPNPDDLACIMYTSGSTGIPKGVMTSHRNIVSAVRGTIEVLDIERGDTMLHYLPLAHSFANLLESIMLYHGVRLGVGSPRTLSSNGVKNCDGDLKTLGPNLFIAVPTIFEKIKHGIMFTVNQKGAIARLVFHIAYTQKLRALKSGRQGAIWDKIVFNKIRDTIGLKKMKYMVTGSAPLSGDMHDFARVIFNCPLLQGYGLTETVSAGTVQRVDDSSNENIGPCVHSTEIKLVDVDEMGYKTSDNPPRGEIWIRGPTITLGYYLEDEKTREAFFDSEDDSPYKWFASGDIGMCLPNGSLKIIDRKKNLIKPPHGEYIALEKLESCYKNCTYVDLICVYVDSKHFDCVAIVTPNRERLTAWAVSQKLPNTDNFPELTKDPKVYDFLLNELKATGRKMKLRSIETIRSITISPFEWTPQNSMLTSAMKLNRNEIVRQYRKDIDRMYDDLENKNN